MRAEQHLTQCAACRSQFRQTSAGWYPKIRNYTIIGELGRGGFGVVYKAIHHSKERVEAIKVLFGKTAQREAYFENEVRLVARLRHPNIAMLFDAHLSTPPLYYAMEFVAGRHLDDYFRAHEVTLEARIELVKTVAAAMGYAHQQGVIHRDLKPQNILIDAQGQPRIVDFGIAKRLVVDPAATEDAGDGRRSEGALGTFGYIAPEQLAGQHVDSRADIYGLGALLFHVITGQPARFAREAERLREVLREGRVSRADDLAAIIACCVRPLPEQRYPSCEALAADLDNYLAGRPIAARQNRSPGYRIARMTALTLRNFPSAVRAAALTVVALLLIAAFWLNGTWLASAPPTAKTPVIVAFLPSTLAKLKTGELDVPGVAVDNRKSWRVLYGRLMQKMAAGRPSVVAWDYYFPDCQPGFDEAFIAGMRAIDAPVIVGARETDVNGEPVLCPEIRAAASGWGLVAGTRPGAGTLAGAVHIPLAVQRGASPSMPALALAAVAAARHPDCDVALRVDEKGLSLRFRKRQVAEGELRWHASPEHIPLSKIESFTTNGVADTYAFGGFSIDPMPAWVSAPLAIETVLAAGPARLRDWLEGRPVIVGQMIPPFDQYAVDADRRMFGCQAQALALHQLGTGVPLVRLGRVRLTGLVCACCLLATVAARWVPQASIRRLRIWVGSCALVLTGALVLAVLLSHKLTTPWAVMASVALCALLAGGAASLLVRLLHERQLSLTPGPFWAAERATSSTTTLASTPRSSG